MTAHGVLPWKVHAILDGACVARFEVPPPRSPALARRDPDDRAAMRCGAHAGQGSPAAFTRRTTASRGWRSIRSPASASMQLKRGVPDS